MAVKKPSKAQREAAVSAAASPAAEGADDLGILHPERTRTIAGRTITVREYGFVEGLKLEPIIKPFIDSLHNVVKPNTSATLDEITAVLGEHHEITLQMMAQSCDVEAEWIDTLNDRDGTTLLHLWWSVCAPFVLKRVFDRWITAAAMDRHKAGASSTKP